MSRSRKALAAAAMAIAAAGGGLLITGAGAVPAYAAAPSPPAGGHPGGHLVATITLQRAAPAVSGPGSNVILPCAVHSPGAAATAGAAPADDTCDSGVIQCHVFADDPFQISVTGIIFFQAFTACTEHVPQISMGQDVIHSTRIDPNNPLTNSDVVTNGDSAATENEAACQPGQYAVNAAARITPPSGYVVTGSLHDTSATLTFNCGGGGSGGGGGGGGCATATPSVSGQPATRRPDLIVCQ